MVHDSAIALHVIHELLLLARKRAADAGAADLAMLLDDIEYLPALVLDPEDKSKEFRDYAAMIANRHQWARVLEVLNSNLKSEISNSKLERLKSPIIHLISESDWIAAKRAGEWRPPSLAAERFIHCSRPKQVAATLKRHFPGRSDMLMLVLDPARITAEIRDEDLYGRGETFPHIYGPLNLDAVIEVKPTPCERP